MYFICTPETFRLSSAWRILGTLDSLLFRHLRVLKKNEVYISWPPPFFVIESFRISPSFTLKGSFWTKEIGLFDFSQSDLSVLWRSGIHGMRSVCCTFWCWFGNEGSRFRLTTHIQRPKNGKRQRERLMKV